MDSLQTLCVKQEYRSDSDDVLHEFYIPCLATSTFYRRAVGYFTSESIRLAALGIEAFIEHDGQMELVASPFMTKGDIDAIEQGYKSRDEIVEQALTREIKSPDSEIIQNAYRCLAWLVANERLDIKIAIRRSGHGLYHEKVGIFSDRDGNKVAFIGSSNETAGGLVGNFESIDVYRSWDPTEASRIERKEAHFADLWLDRTNSLKVQDFPEACRKELLSYKPDFRPTIYRSTRGNSLAAESIKLPNGITLRDYQRVAISNWFKNNGRGTFKMATGSGKTYLALGAVLQLISDAHLRAAIVICPFSHLVEQWRDQARGLGFDPIQIYRSRSKWLDLLDTKLSRTQQGQSDFLLAIATNRSFASDTFQRRLALFPHKTVLIADEAHNLGAEQLQTRLPQEINWRMALSATPERWFDDIGTQALFDYFGPVLDPEFSLSDAIQAGVLTRYRYYPILVHLTESERDEYIQLSTKIARIFTRSEPTEENPHASHLLIQRARLVSSAKNKLVELRKLIENTHDILSHTLVYCGDGRVECDTNHDEMKQIEAVCKLLGRDLGIRISPFVAETSSIERRELLDNLDSGRLQALVAIRCLDEGVDLPTIRNAIILASSSNPRQFIQRRGRILRLAQGKTEATIYDMIVVPPDEVVEIDAERSLLRKEFLRFAEFADLALNGFKARSKILNIQKKFGLLDI
jgi:DNA phosphorothioation system restriction enzyme